MTIDEVHAIYAMIQALRYEIRASAASPDGKALLQQIADGYANAVRDSIKAAK